MQELYVYDNEKLGVNGDQFNDDSYVGCILGLNEEDCLVKFDADYGTNDYSASFTHH